MFDLWLDFMSFLNRSHGGGLFYVIKVCCYCDETKLFLVIDKPPFVWHSVLQRSIVQRVSG